jgi:hypothetical protein
MSCQSHKTVVGTFPPETPSPSPTVAPTPTPVPTPIFVTGTKMFQTPSHNIACVMSRTTGTPLYARCDIANRTWKAPKKPKDCPGDYGNGASLEDGKHGELSCAGDTLLKQGDVLPYGQRVRAGQITCQVERAGVTCANTASRHGFFISKASYRLF